MPTYAPRVFTPDLPILTERLALRAIRTTDLDVYAELNTIPEVVRYLYWDVLSREESAHKLSRIVGRTGFASEGDSVVFAVDLRETGEMIGDVVLVWTSTAHQSGEVGYVIHPCHARRGYATEATRALLTLGFEALALHRIVARADARNTSSTRVMENLGMRREALLRQNEWVKGEWTDEVVYAILEDEWRAQADG